MRDVYFVEKIVGSSSSRCNDDDSIVEDLEIVSIVLPRQRSSGCKRERDMRFKISSHLLPSQCSHRSRTARKRCLCCLSLLRSLLISSLPAVARRGPQQNTKTSRRTSSTCRDQSLRFPSRQGRRHKSITYISILELIS